MIKTCCDISHLELASKLDRYNCPELLRNSRHLESSFHTHTWLVTTCQLSAAESCQASITVVKSDRSQCTDHFARGSVKTFHAPIAHRMIRGGVCVCVCVCIVGGGSCDMSVIHRWLWLAPRQKSVYRDAVKSLSTVSVWWRWLPWFIALSSVSVLFGLWRLTHLRTDVTSANPANVCACMCVRVWCASVRCVCVRACVCVCVCKCSVLAPVVNLQWQGATGKCDLPRHMTARTRQGQP